MSKHPLLSSTPSSFPSLLDFLINGIERRVGIDLNNDGYIGGEGNTFHRISSSQILFSFSGFMSKLERVTHIDFNRDNIIGRPYDVPYYAPTILHPPATYYGGYSSAPYTRFTYAPTRFAYY